MNKLSPGLKADRNSGFKSLKGAYASRASNRLSVRKVS